MAQGLISYAGLPPGTGSFTLSHGITPSVCTMELAPQPQLPPANGSLVFTFGEVLVAFPSCRLNALNYSRTSGYWSLQILDRRWKWAYGKISGRYNVRKNDEVIDQATVKTPQQLATLCLLAMGETVSASTIAELPDDTRPAVEWANDNPAQALDELVNALGCRVVLQLDNTVKVCRLGVGAALPGDTPLTPVMDDSGSIDPPDPPDAIEIAFAPTRVQALLQLFPVGMDTDGKIKWIEDLSYKPAAGWGNEIPGVFSGVNDTGTTAAAGQRETNPRNLALRTVFRWYQIGGTPDEQFGSKLKEQLGDEYDLEDFSQFLPLLPDLIDVDPETKKPMEPWIQGNFALLDGMWVNSPNWETYPLSFTVQLERGIVEFADPVFQWATPGNAASLIAGANIYLNCTFNVLGKTTKAAHRYLRHYDLGAANNTGARILKQEELGYWLQPTYDVSGLVTGWTNNQLAVNSEAGYLFAAAVAEYELEAAAERTYAGLVPINPDGAIQQVTFAVRGGATTRASRNNESNRGVPSYRERRLLSRLYRDQARDHIREMRRQARQRGSRRAAL
jgi:hypothetical protein